MLSNYFVFVNLFNYISTSRPPYITQIIVWLLDQLYTSLCCDWHYDSCFCGDFDRRIFSIQKCIWPDWWEVAWPLAALRSYRCEKFKKSGDGCFMYCQYYLCSLIFSPKLIFETSLLYICRLIIAILQDFHKKQPITFMLLSIERFIKYYNEKRIKEKLGWMSPVQYRLSLLTA